MSVFFLIAYLTASVVAPDKAGLTFPVLDIDHAVVMWDTKAPGEGWVSAGIESGRFVLDIQHEDTK